MWSAVLVGQSVGLRRIASGWLGWLVLLGAVGVAMAGVFSHGGPAGLHWGTMRPEPARQSLSSLPLAAQGPISRVLGAANRSYVVHRGAAGGASTGPVTLTTLAGTVRARSRFYVT